jgi:uncharacterized protein (TIGR02996 family)
MTLRFLPARGVFAETIDPMDPSHAPFLAAILADADSDAPRLRYADFLDETGEANHAERAEFIRIQCALEGMPMDDSRYGELARRESDLMRANWRDWFAPIATALGVPLRERRVLSPWSRPRENFAFAGPSLRRERMVTSPTNGFREFRFSAWFGRGFVEHFSMALTGPESVAGFGRVLDLTPLKSFSPLGTGEYLPALLADERFRRIRALYLDSPDERFLRDLGASERSNSLRHLDLTIDCEAHAANRFDPVPILAGASCLFGLRGLALAAYPEAVSYDLAPLLGSPLLRGVTRHPHRTNGM